MKKITLALGLLLSTAVFSQSYVGYLNDNYSGVHNVINNPANLVDSRIKLDVNIVGASGYFGNNLTDFGTSYDIYRDYDKHGVNADYDKYVKDFTFLDKNHGALNIDVLGPSVAFNLNEKHSLAIFTRVRAMANANDIPGSLYHIIKPGVQNSTDFNIKTQDGTRNIVGNSWGEFGVSYATILLNKKQHFLKGGLSLKYLQGVAAIRSNFTNASANVDFTDNGNDYTIESKGDIEYGRTNNLFNTVENDKKFVLPKSSNGFGADFGLTYEWRPEYSTKKRPEQNKYKLRFGLSVTDLGSLTYKNARTDYFDATRPNGSKGLITKSEVTGLDYETLTDLEGSANVLFNKTKSVNELETTLPTALHFNTDWNVNDFVYLNLDTNFDLTSNGSSTNIENTYSVTPRIEKRSYSVALPLSYREFSGFSAGVSLRTGPLYIGSGSIITNLLSRESKSIDVFAGFKVQLFAKSKDTDKDGIVDADDMCPEVPGPIENKGCLWGDKDNDGVKDNVDKCIDVAGPSENNGCPWGDKDNDGVKDNVDKCVNVAGPSENNGCPWGDKDNDGVKDNVDKCIDVAGTIKNNGCPEDNSQKQIDFYTKSIYFNTAKYSFKEGVDKTLDMIVGVMKQYANHKYSIEGHADNQGTNVSNLKLSDRRAKAVMNYLVNKGISADRLTTKKYGEEKPVDTNETASGRANNRRVEIRKIN